ncbi:MAG: glycosyltransferase family 2 protein [Candidatus Ventricola sp.]
MRVSIIVPCYNSARYLSACVDSILAQSMQDFEALLIDDGSTDGTLALAQALAAGDARLRVLHQENAGVSAARNLGLSQARGEWITFVDSDDLLTPDALATMLSAATDSVDLVVCAHKTFAPDGAEQIVIPQTRWMDGTPEAVRHAAGRRLIEGDSVLNIMCNKLHRRSRIAGLRLDERVRIAEDALFNLEAVLLGQGIAYVNHVTYLYRTHEASAMHTHSGGELARHLPWLRALRETLLRLGVMERYYADYLNSVVLRLYKDGGVGGVLRHFERQARPLVVIEGMDVHRMSARSRMLLLLARSGAYPIAYPLIYPAQVLLRKLGEAAFALRAGKEMPQ